MDIILFGRSYWLLTAGEYKLCTKFLNFLELKTVAVGDFSEKIIPFAEKHGLFYGFATRKGKELPFPFLFFGHKDSWYPVNPEERACSKCGVTFDAVNARVYDLYRGADNINEAFQWGLSLPYVDKCPHCGFDENGNGLKYLAIFYDGKIITALDN